MKTVKFTIKSYDKLPKQFLDVPELIFRGNKHYVKPLNIDVKKNLDFNKHPYWSGAEHSVFIAYQGNELVARGIAIYNRDYQKLNIDNCGFFGFIDSIDNQEVFNELVHQIELFLKTKKCTKMIGPLNPSINYELGVLTSGFEKDPYFMMTYNPKYYLKLYKNAGFLLEAEFYAYKVLNTINQKKIDKIRSLITHRFKAEIVEFDYANFKESVNELCEIYNDAFEGHYGALPMSKDEFYFIAKDMKLIMDKKLLFRVAVKGEIAGFILALPNLNEAIKKLKNGKLNPINLIKLLYYKRKVKSFKVMIAVIKHKYQHMGLGSLLYAEMATRVKNGGYARGELSWVSSDNIQMLKAIESMGGELTKTYALYKKRII